MVKFCMDCGTQLEDDALFCHNCGKKSEYMPNSDSQKSEILSPLKKRTEKFQKNLKNTGRKRAKIPHLGGINEIREDSFVIKKTNEVIPFKDIENFSLHQSSQSLWSDIKVDFDYNGLHYRTQQAGTDKGKLQTVERKLNALEMQKYSSASSNDAESKVDKLKELKELLDSGVVDEDEFKQLKDEIING